MKSNTEDGRCLFLLLDMAQVDNEHLDSSQKNTPLLNESDSLTFSVFYETSCCSWSYRLTDDHQTKN